MTYGVTENIWKDIGKAKLNQQQHFRDNIKLLNVTEKDGLNERKNTSLTQGRRMKTLALSGIYLKTNSLM